MRVRSTTADEAVLGTPAASPRRLGRAFPAFRHRNFTLFWTGSLISSIGTWMQNVTVPYVLLFVMHTSPIWVGVATVSQFLPSVLLGPYAGSFADRFPRKLVVLVSQIVQGVAAMALWGAWVTDNRRPIVYVALVGVGGIANGLNLPAFQALVSDIVPREDLLNAVTLTAGQFNGARAIGPAITGVVLAAYGPSWTFLVNAVSFIAVVAALAVMRTAPFQPDPDRRSAIKEFVEGLRYVRGEVGIIVAVVTALAIATLGLPVSQMSTIMARDVFHVSPGRYGVLASAYGAGAVAGAVAIGGVIGARVRRSRLIAGGVIGFGILLGAVALAPTFWFAVAALAGCGLCFITCIPVLNTSIQLGVEERMRGRALALYFIALTGGFPLGSLAESWLAGVIGVRQSIGLAAALLLLVGLTYVVRPRLLNALETPVYLDAAESPAAVPGA